MTAGAEGASGILGQPFTLDLGEHSTQPPQLEPMALVVNHNELLVVASVAAESSIQYTVVRVNTSTDVISAAVTAKNTVRLPGGDTPLPKNNGYTFTTLLPDNNTFLLSCVCDNSLWSRHIAIFESPQASVDESFDFYFFSLEAATIVPISWACFALLACAWLLLMQKWRRRGAANGRWGSKHSPIRQELLLLCRVDKTFCV